MCNSVTHGILWLLGGQSPLCLQTGPTGHTCCITQGLSEPRSGSACAEGCRHAAQPCQGLALLRHQALTSRPSASSCTESPCWQLRAHVSSTALLFVWAREADSTSTGTSANLTGASSPAVLAVPPGTALSAGLRRGRPQFRAGGSSVLSPFPHFPPPGRSRSPLRPAYVQSWL